MATMSTVAETESDLIGVSNPYALAELVAGRTIDWQRVPEPPRLLEELLATPYEELFDPEYDSPLYLGVRTTDQGLERVRPAVLDVQPPAEGSDDDLLTFSDPSRLRTIGDLGPYFDTDDVAGIAIEHAAYVDTGVLRLHIAHVGQSRLERLARIFTPFLVTAVLDVPGFNLDDTFTFEPPVSYWGEGGDFFNEAAEFFDPIQGSVANCYLIAAMSAVAWAQPYRIRHLTRASGPAQHQFVNKVTFVNHSSGASSDVEVSSAIPLRYSNNQPMYARSSETGETWPSIVEKAYAKWTSGHTGDTPSIPSTAYGSTTRACAELTGLTRWSVATSNTSADQLWSLVRQNSLSHRTFNPMVAATYGSGKESPDKVVYGDANLVANHAYTVLGWDYRNGKKYIILRNPWGRTEATKGALTGTISMYDISWWRSIALADDDGVFGLEVGVFKQYFSGLGGAK